MNSRLYVGQVNHRRFMPHQHGFSYSMFMMYLDLDELPTLFDHFLLWSAGSFNLAWFKRSDHLGDPAVPLKQSVHKLVEQRTGIQLDGPVYLLTHLRYFGFGFNPVSFYYCHDQHHQLRAIVAEVNNTPWGEQYCYVLPAENNLGDRQHHRYALEKAFHVSPFNPMQQSYSWRFRVPDEALGVHMENWQQGEKYFDASMAFSAQEINARNLRKALLRFPLITVKIVAAIYWQALKLWLKKTPIYDHPDKLTQQSLNQNEVD